MRSQERKEGRERGQRTLSLRSGVFINHRTEGRRTYGRDKIGRTTDPLSSFSSLLEDFDSQILTSVQVYKLEVKGEGDDSIFTGSHLSPSIF